MVKELVQDYSIVETGSRPRSVWFLIRRRARAVALLVMLAVLVITATRVYWVLWTPDPVGTSVNFYFTGKETEAQRSRLSCSRSQSQEAVELDLSLRFAWLQWQGLGGGGGREKLSAGCGWAGAGQGRAAVRAHWWGTGVRTGNPEPSGASWITGSCGVKKLEGWQPCVEGWGLCSPKTTCLVNAVEFVWETLYFHWQSWLDEDEKSPRPWAGWSSSGEVLTPSCWYQQWQLRMF